MFPRIGLAVLWIASVLAMCAWPSLILLGSSDGAMLFPPIWLFATVAVLLIGLMFSTTGRARIGVLMASIPLLMLQLSFGAWLSPMVVHVGADEFAIVQQGVGDARRAQVFDSAGSHRIAFAQSTRVKRFPIGQQEFSRELTWDRRSGSARTMVVAMRWKSDVQAESVPEISHCTPTAVLFMADRALEQLRRDGLSIDDPELLKLSLTSRVANQRIPVEVLAVRFQ